MGPIVVLAEQDGVDQFPHEITELLSILGHPEALVTDESWITHFIDVTLQGAEYDAAKVAIWSEIEKRYPGIEVSGEVVLLKLARAIYWHKRAGHA